MRAECVVKIAIFQPFELLECMLNNKNNRLDFSTILEKGGGAHPMYVYYNSSTERAIIRQKVQFRDGQTISLR